jgi:hypothetical protein
VLIYDGDHPQARRFARWVEPRLPLGIAALPGSSVDDLGALGLTPGDVAGRVWWIGVDGRPRRGPAAVIAAVWTCLFSGRKPS